MIEAMNILQLLEAVVTSVWVCYFILLIVLIIVSLRDRDNGSSIVSIAVIGSIGALTDFYLKLLLQTNPHVELTSLQAWLVIHKEVMLYAWYIGLCLLSLIAIYTTYKLHRKFNLTNTYFTKTFLSAAFFDSMINLTRFSERYIWDTDYLGGLYRWGLLSINICVFSMAVVITVKITYESMINKMKSVRES